ncbi:MAG: insulinase family protein [Planctomycetota bacterium]|nr:insulinase family protein [Planctomycetota bacterium]
MPQPQLKEGARLEGFQVRRVTPMPELRSTALELEHENSGARVLHVHNDDSENLFAVTFRTPPVDDTGLPHILEHSVLGGSKRFPVKDPFVEMLKMSMATFINAMTGSDMTLYPVASNVKKDLFNLAEVYWDAVFHPNLTENTFKQEGHHLEFETKGDTASPLIVKGIVFNEMKGAYSRPEMQLVHIAHRALFEETPYGLSSGGDPEAIPTLTYEKFIDFYKRHYTPANAYIFLYGDTPTPEYLAFIAARLAGAKRDPRTPPIKCQTRWKAPRDLAGTYSIDEGEDEKNKAFLFMRWIVGSGTDLRDVIDMELLDYLLLGNAGAPLRKALVDSRLGEDLVLAGFNGFAFESTFGIGLKGTEAARKADFEKLVFETLEKCAKDGFPRERVEAGFHQLSYPFLEISNMQPLNVMYKAYLAWLHDADPLDYLRIKETLETARVRCTSDLGLFPRLIRERLLDNPHRVSLTLAPEKGLQSKKDRDAAEKLQERKAALSKEQLEKIAREQNELVRMQDTPNSPEALATLPQLKVSDLPRKPKHIPTKLETLPGGAAFLSNDVFANGVTYLRLSFDLAGLDPGLIAVLPLYSSCARKMGAAGCDYVKMAERADASTGSLGFGVSASGHVADPEAIRFTGTYSLKVLDHKLPDALGVLRDVLFEPDFSDAKRFHEVLLQEKAALRSRLPSSGNVYALAHAGRALHRLGRLDEELGGIPQPRHFQAWADAYDAHRDALVEKLKRVRAFLLGKRPLAASFTGSSASRDLVAKAVADWTAKMTEAVAPVAPAPFTPPAAPLREGLAAPMQVAYCARVLPAPHLSHPDAAALTVGRLLISRGYMWEEVRIKGGAYGGGAGWNGLDRSWTFWSYRDPWVKRTLDAFRNLREHIAKTDWSQTDIDRAIIGTAKDGERPIRPEAATGQALSRHLLGDTPERREERHAAVLRVKVADVKRACLDVLDNNFEKGSVCVASSREKLEAANKELGAEALAIEDALK